MKKRWIVFFTVAALLLAGTLFAEEAEQSVVKDFVIVEASAGIQNRAIDEVSGETIFDKNVASQTALLNAEKNGTGFIFLAENFQSIHATEINKTYLFAAMYKKIGELKIGGGYGFYWEREKGESDYHAFYLGAEFPKIAKTVIPFARVEYRLGTETFRNENNRSIPNNGFLYRAGFKGEFDLSEKISLVGEVSAGGNAGLYDYRPENLAFARGMIALSYEMVKGWDLRPYAVYQLNLGRRDGIASEAEGKVMVGLTLNWSWQKELSK